MGDTQFQAYLKAEIDKTKGISYPVRAGILRRLFVRNAPCAKLHPNPNDEFCHPKIGPNYAIMSGYAEEFRRYNKEFKHSLSSAYEPVEVEKVRPDGYMILNGHHRWGAAYKVGKPSLRIRIVNLTQKNDIQKMLKKARNSKRITLDLDEVVFRPKDDPWLEKPIPFLQGRIYKERLRLGVPALFHTLKDKGYDIWIYSSKNYSVDYLRYYFLYYSVHVTGIVTGTARRGPGDADVRKELEEMVNTKYESTVHVDNEAVIRSWSDSRRFEEFRLSGAPETWSREVIAVFEEMKEK